MHGEQGQHQSDASDHAGRDHAGMRELDVEAEDADEQEDEERVRFDDAREEALARGHIVLGELGAGEREALGFAVEARDGPAIELEEQIAGGCGDYVDEFAVERFGFGEGLGVGDGGFGELHIAAAFCGITAKKRGGVAHDFILERFVDVHDLAANFEQWRSAAGVRGGGHSCDIG